MLTFLQEAGFPIWFVLTLGAASLLCAAQYARTGTLMMLYAVAGLALATLLAGTLGTVVGVQASVRYIDASDEKWLFLIGLREALNNLVLAQCIVLVDVLVVTARLSWGTRGQVLRNSAVSRGVAAQ